MHDDDEIARATAHYPAPDITPDEFEAAKRAPSQLSPAHGGRKRWEPRRLWLRRLFRGAHLPKAPNVQRRRQADQQPQASRQGRA